MTESKDRKRPFILGRDRETGPIVVEMTPGEFKLWQMKKYPEPVPEDFNTLDVRLIVTSELKSAGRMDLHELCLEYITWRKSVRSDGLEWVSEDGVDVLRPLKLPNKFTKIPLEVESFIEHWINKSKRVTEGARRKRYKED